jgi:glycosyltransferase involved in cell wall biosynthesis
MPSRRLRGIVIVVYNLDAVGGMERQAKRLAEHLAARGLEVTVVTTRPEPRLTFPPRPGKPWCERLGRMSIVRVPAYENWTSGAIERLMDVTALWVLMRRRRRVAVIHSIQYTGARHAALAAEVTGLPATVKFSGSGEHGDFHVLERREDANEIRDALGRMSRYVTISEDILKEARKAGLDPARAVKIRNGVDTRRFSPEGRVTELSELGLPARAPVVLFVGRHDTEKRVDLLLRAFARTLAEIPEARLVSVGPGPRLDEYRELARALGIAHNVAFLGARSDVDALYRAAAVFVLPSASEGLPNALLEALACGTPCVATKIPGTTEVVTHEKDALLVPPDDEDALSGAIVRLLRDRELTHRLSRAGQARVQAEFDMERVADQYFALFSGLARNATPDMSESRRQLRFARVLATRVLSLAFTVFMIQAREAITRTVVSAKRILGIEGDLLGTLQRG